MGRKRIGNLVLDIDGTLIDSLSKADALKYPCKPDYITEWGDYIYFRPHLEAFLKYAFSRFENVGIWTAACPEWAEMVIFKALKPMLERINQELSTNGSLASSPVQSPPTSPAGPKRGADQSDDTEPSMFAFVFTQDKCKRRQVADNQTRSIYEYHTKPLSRIWKRKSFRRLGWNSSNTLILEDTPQNCLANYGNALYIRTFSVKSVESRFDAALRVLPVFLDRLRHEPDIRSIEKRHWETLCAQNFLPAPFWHATSDTMLHMNNDNLSWLGCESGLHRNSAMRANHGYGESSSYQDADSDLEYECEYEYDLETMSEESDSDQEFLVSPGFEEIPSPRLRHVPEYDQHFNHNPLILRSSPEEAELGQAFCGFLTITPGKGDAAEDPLD